MSYSGIVAAITVRPHPDPAIERLAVGVVAGFQVIVGKDTPDGTIGVFFPTDGCFSHEMCHQNNLYRTGKGINKDPQASGYFEEARRIRTQKFRKVASEGIWLPLESLAWTGVDLSSLKPGDEITSLNGKLICEKYFTRATLRAMKSAQKQGRVTPVMTMFKEHFSTGQLRYMIAAIPEGARLIVTEKLHGTSGRSCHGIVEMPEQSMSRAARAYNWVANRLGWPVIKPQKFWDHVMGTRRVVRFEDGGTQKGYFSRQQTGDYYAGTDFRQIIHDQLRLHKGETLYYEIVGWDGKGGTIMAKYGLDGSDEVYRELRKQYGDKEMIFSYGQEQNTYGIYVYRITMTNEDGQSVEYSWDQVMARCRDLGLKTVPLIDELRPCFILDSTGDGLVEINREDFIDLCSKWARGPSLLDSTHIREGVCVRVEHPEMSTVLKWKGFEFAHLEGIKKNEDDFVDTEEVA